MAMCNLEEKQFVEVYDSTQRVHYAPWEQWRHTNIHPGYPDTKWNCATCETQLEQGHGMDYCPECNRRILREQQR